MCGDVFILQGLADQQSQTARERQKNPHNWESGSVIFDENWLKQQTTNRFGITLVSLLKTHNRDKIFAWPVDPLLKQLLKPPSSCPDAQKAQWHERRNIWIWGETKSLRERTRSSAVQAPSRSAGNRSTSLHRWTHNRNVGRRSDLWTSSKGQQRVFTL